MPARPAACPRPGLPAGPAQADLAPPFPSFPPQNADKYFSLLSRTQPGLKLQQRLRYDQLPSMTFKLMVHVSRGPAPPRGPRPGQAPPPIRSHLWPGPAQNSSCLQTGPASYQVPPLTQAPPTTRPRLQSGRISDPGPAHEQAPHPIRSRL